jgi:GH25 family lysozyme M1 (1,4-beta-N-acetylmuramidase)
MLLIVDLSNNNGTVDFPRLAKLPGLAGVYLKASEGTSFIDHTFHARREEANAVGLRVGAYHFARFGNVQAEAGLFCRVVEKIERRDLRPALDAEVSPGASAGPWCRAWNQAVRSKLGAGPLLYSYPYWLEQLKSPTPIGYGLWLAAYSRDDGVEHPYSVPAPWRRAVLHQFTSRGHVPGVVGECDVSAGRLLNPLLAHPVGGRVG